MLDDKRIEMVHASQGVLDAGSQTVIVHMLRGQRVWVQNFDNASHSVFGKEYCSFSGVLLQRF
ncbi:hypothetical protein DPMN_057716 [Dreissena polymorpha]|uniref:C1q domain-containing protein n=1 Tax=Dreissena polymorpha TaxID=45954 RepID=A0A9D4C0G1_DREPO|nr:hypothetical protein DPMN_057716 [Dreissena polymorpha]